MISLPKAFGVPFGGSAIAATGGESSVLAAKAATATIPIVFISTDPVKLGLVASLNRPGGKLTGVNTLNTELVAKRLELLHELVPTATIIGALINPESPTAEALTSDLHSAARILGLQLHVLHAMRAPNARLILPSELWPNCEPAGS